MSYMNPYMWILKKTGTDDLIYKAERDRCGEQTYGYQQAKRVCGMNQEIGIDPYTLSIVCIK